MALNNTTIPLQNCAQRWYANMIPAYLLLVI